MDKQTLFSLSILFAWNQYSSIILRNIHDGIPTNQILSKINIGIKWLNRSIKDVNPLWSNGRATDYFKLYHKIDPLIIHSGSLLHGTVCSNQQPLVRPQDYTLKKKIKQLLVTNWFWCCLLASTCPDASPPHLFADMLAIWTTCPAHEYPLCHLQLHLLAKWPIEPPKCHLRHLIIRHLTSSDRMPSVLQGNLRHSHQFQPQQRRTRHRPR